MAKNAGEAEGGAGDKTWKWEQTSTGGESEVLVRFTLGMQVTKKQVKTEFKPQSLKVTVAGEALFDGKLYGKIYPEECTWSLAKVLDERVGLHEQMELQVLLSLAEDVKWHDLGAKA